MSNPITPIPYDQAWELEYSNPQLLTAANEPTKECADFVRWLRRDQGEDLGQFRWLDLGCGTGRNLNYAVGQNGGSGVGLDISRLALKQAREMAGNLPVEYLRHDLNEALAVDGPFDAVIDSTSSHLVAPERRAKLFSEVAERLAPGGYYYLRTLVLDGDRNAQNLLKISPGPDVNSYVHPTLGVVEYMWRADNLVAALSPQFEIMWSKKYTGYQRYENQSYKRRYWVGYLKKRANLPK